MSRKISRQIGNSFVLQKNQSDCGVACLSSIIKFYGGNPNQEKLRIESGTTKQGTTLLGLYQTALKVGFNSEGMMRDSIFQVYKQLGDKRRVRKSIKYSRKPVEYARVNSQVRVLTINLFYGKNILQMLLWGGDNRYNKLLRSCMGLPATEAQIPNQALLIALHIGRYAIKTVVGLVVEQHATGHFTNG